MTFPKTTEAIDQALPELLAWLQSTAERGTDLLAKEAPLIAHEIWVRGVVTMGGLAVVFWVLVVWGIVMWKRSYDLLSHNKQSLSSEELFGHRERAFGWGMFVAVVSFVMCLPATISILRILVAPRLYVLEQIRSML